MPDLPFSFPDDFIWGAATSAYQIEGAADAEGKGLSVWDVFCQQPGRVRDGSSGRTACDHYHRFSDDFDIMRRLGVKAYRFSLSWARLFPEGRGRPNEAGFAYYDRLIDALLERGIEPWITLFHWDTPYALEKDFGGWLSRDIVGCFGDYAVAVGNRYGDRVKHFFTTNEFGNFTDRAYYAGEFAPGRHESRKRRNQARHHAILAHGVGVQALRSSVSGARVGLAEDPLPVIPVFETKEHIDAARQAYRLLNAHFTTAILEGRYPDQYLREEGDDAPDQEAEDFDIISSQIDFFGFNAYSPTHVRAASNDRGYEVISPPASYPRMGPGPWPLFGPEVLYWGCRFQKELWNLDEIYVSENGCPCADDLTREDEILDTDRVLYLRHHLRNAHRAMNEGYPLKGYFQWSLLDNFEWTEGYRYRFGIVHVDFESQKRTEKLSAEFYRETILANAVL